MKHVEVTLRVVLDAVTMPEATGKEVAEEIRTAVEDTVGELWFGEKQETCYEVRFVSLEDWKAWKGATTP